MNRRMFLNSLVFLPFIGKNAKRGVTEPPQPCGGVVKTTCDYGAAGDGASDDTASIENALQQGGILLFSGVSLVDPSTAFIVQPGAALTSYGGNHGLKFASNSTGNGLQMQQPGRVFLEKLTMQA